MTRAGGVQIICTCITPARCTPRQQLTEHLVALVKLHQCAKLSVASLPFPEIRGALVKNVIRLWHVQHAPLWDGNPKGSRFTVGAMYPVNETPVPPPVWPVAVTTYFMQCFARRHVARATWRRPTRDRHHRRSEESPRRTVPPTSRSVQPFGLQMPKSLDTQTD